MTEKYNIPLAVRVSKRQKKKVAKASKESDPKISEAQIIRNLIDNN